LKYNDFLYIYAAILKHDKLTVFFKVYQHEKIIFVSHFLYT